MKNQEMENIEVIENETEEIVDNVQPTNEELKQFIEDTKQDIDINTIEKEECSND